MPTHDLFQKYVLPTYARIPLSFVKGRGATLWDESGKKYLDFVAGVAVNNLGYAHPAMVKAIKAQAVRLIHLSNLYEIREQGLLASELIKYSGLDKAFFCNSGAEAVEACIKLARYYSIKNYSSDRYEIIVCENSFHGRTLGALSATAQKKYREGFGPLVEGFKIVPYDDIEKISGAITEKTCAVLVEPVQGEGGVNIPDASYLSRLRELCSQKNILLILDEVQVGMGRLGSLFAYQQTGITPDMVALAKGLGCGFPVGAVLASDKIASVARPGIHASTFGGNPLACAVGLAILSVISKKSFLEKILEKGSYFLQILHKLKEKHPVIENVRGRGLMLACDLKDDLASQVVAKARDKGMLFNCIQNKTLRFVPPLVVTKAEIKKAALILDQILGELNMTS